MKGCAQNESILDTVDAETLFPWLEMLNHVVIAPLVQISDLGKSRAACPPMYDDSEG